MKSVETYTLGIIIPCYNVEKYLQQCIDSLLNNINDEILLVFVNDCSTDRTKDILDKLNFFKLKNVKVINSEVNLGLSGARNLGLDLIGDSCGYISFVDSDDFVENGYYNEILSVIYSENPDIIEYNCFNYISDSNKTLRRIIPEGRSGLSSIQRNYFNYLFDKGQMFVHCRAIKYSIIKGEKFPVGRRYEDTFFTPKIYLKAKTVYSCNNVLLNYRVNDSGITKNPIKKDIFDFFESWATNSKLFKNDQSILNSIDNSFVLLIIAFSRNIGYPDLVKSLIKIIKFRGIKSIPVIYKVVKKNI